MTGDPRVCEHGSLRRQCPICDSAKDIEELEAQVTQLRATLADAQKVRDEWFAEYRAKRDECDRLQRELKFLRGLVKERESAGNDIPPWLALEWIDTAVAPSTDDAQGEVK